MTDILRLISILSSQIKGMTNEIGGNEKLIRDHLLPISRVVPSLEFFQVICCSIMLTQTQKIGDSSLLSIFPNVFQPVYLLFPNQCSNNSWWYDATKMEIVKCDNFHFAAFKQPHWPEVHTWNFGTYAQGAVPYLLGASVLQSSAQCSRCSDCSISPAHLSA